MKRESIETIGISEFKARCIALLKKVKRNKQRLVVTLRGEPIAEVVYIGWSERVESQRTPGTQVKTTKILGDIVESGFDTDWDSLK